MLWSRVKDDSVVSWLSALNHPPLAYTSISFSLPTISMDMASGRVFSSGAMTRSSVAYRPSS